MKIENGAEVIITLKDEELERSIADLGKLKHLLSGIMLKANFEGQGKNDAKELEKDFDVAIEAMEQMWLTAQKGAVCFEWILIKDCLPKDGERVLLSREVHLTDGRKKEEVLIAYYDSENKDWLTEEESPEIISYPVAWMRLPPAYKEREKEDEAGESEGENG